MRQRLWALVALVAIAPGLVPEGCTPADINRQLERVIERVPPITRIGRQPPAEPADGGGQTETTAAMERLVYDRINDIRLQAGLAPLAPHGPLAAVARRYSQRMAEENFFSHVSPTGDSPAERVTAANLPYWIVGENLFTSTNAPDPAPLAVESWMESPGHRANILRSSFTETGVGVWQTGNTYYFTQLFLRPL
jgi:uncharacterized protein YkwD